MDNNPTNPFQTTGDSTQTKYHDSLGITKERAEELSQAVQNALNNEARSDNGWSLTKWLNAATKHAKTANEAAFISTHVGMNAHQMMNEDPIDSILGLIVRKARLAREEREAAKSDTPASNV